MKVVKSNSTSRIFTDDIKTYDKLPAGFYEVDFVEFQGFMLNDKNKFEINEKLYGEHIKLADRVINLHNLSNRNTGVILSGLKGIGKSLFAKHLALKAMESGLPVILVDRFISGIDSFIESIEQDVMVLFDEFDKTFEDIKDNNGDSKHNPQTELLSMFDGTTTGKKLFIITCNELYKLNDYLLNRPGRFHYHFRFDYPTNSEMIEYLQDNLNESKQNQISNIVAFSSKKGLNYDCLRAICFELNNFDDKFEDVINYLNIINDEKNNYKIIVTLNDGTVYLGENELDLYSGEIESFSFLDLRSGKRISIRFDSSKTMYDQSSFSNFVSTDAVDLIQIYTDGEGWKKENVKTVKHIVFDRKIKKNTTKFAV